MSMTTYLAFLLVAGLLGIASVFARLAWQSHRERTAAEAAQVERLLAEEAHETPVSKAAPGTVTMNFWQVQRWVHDNRPELIFHSWQDLKTVNEVRAQMREPIIVAVH